MGIRIRKGTTEEAKRELWSFTNAFPGSPWNEYGDVYEFAPFDESEIPMFNEMEHNSVIEVFEL